MSVNKTYQEKMDKQVKNLVDNGKYDKVTNHATFDPAKLEMPEGITTESIQAHVGWINELSSATEQATAIVAQTAYADNNKLTTVDASLNLDAFTINSQFHLSQQVGEEHIYGQSMTEVMYIHSEELANWTDMNRTANQEAAAKLFG